MEEKKMAPMRAFVMVIHAGGLGERIAVNPMQIVKMRELYANQQVDGARCEITLVTGEKLRVKNDLFEIDANAILQ